jgi:deoxycytidylate deaminase/thymidylate synthase
MIRTIKAESANEAYIKACTMFQVTGGEAVFGRQKGEIYEEQYIAFDIANPRKCLVSLPFRKLSRKYCAGEFALFMGKEQRVEAFEYYSTKWRDLNVDGIVKSAYGWRIFTPRLNEATGECTSRFDYALTQLLENPQTKNAVIMMRDDSDNLDASRKDKCCTLYIQFFIRNNRLDMTVAMRSSDYWFGLPYDLFWYSMLMQRMLYKYNAASAAIQDVPVELGSYMHICNSLHVYQKEWVRVQYAELPTYYDTNKDYQFPLWDHHTERELEIFLEWEQSYRYKERDIVRMANSLREMKLHPFLETMGSFLVNTVVDKYASQETLALIAIAHEYAKNSTCLDRQVGCVLLLEDHTLVKGYNKVLACDKNCHDKFNRVCETSHAEIEALSAAQHMYPGKKIAKAFVTLYPCLPCMQALQNADVKEIVVMGFSHKGATGKVTLIDPAFVKE